MNTFMDEALKEAYQGLSNGGNKIVMLLMFLAIALICIYISIIPIQY